MMLTKTQSAQFSNWLEKYAIFIPISIFFWMLTMFNALDYFEIRHLFLITMIIINIIGHTFQIRDIIKILKDKE